MMVITSKSSKNTEIKSFFDVKSRIFFFYKLKIYLYQYCLVINVILTIYIKIGSFFF